MSTVSRHLGGQQRPSLIDADPFARVHSTVADSRSDPYHQVAEQSRAEGVDTTEKRSRGSRPTKRFLVLKVLPRFFYPLPSRLMTKLVRSDPRWGITLLPTLINPNPIPLSRRLLHPPPLRLPPHPHQTIQIPIPGTDARMSRNAKKRGRVLKLRVISSKRRERSPLTKERGKRPSLRLPHS